MKSWREKDLSWLGAPAFIVIVVLLLFSVNQAEKTISRITAEKILTAGVDPAISASVAPGH